MLGAAEAGFFPGIILFLTYWFPAAYRARMVGRFMAAVPISTVIGAPLSGLILGLDGVWGLRGWQWLFICEGVPTVLLGLVVMFYLTDGPHKAHWLEADERRWLTDRLWRERMVREAHAEHSLWQARRHPRVLLLSLVYFGNAAANYGLGFWLPTIVKNFGISNLETGFVTAIPYVVGAFSMVLWPLLSDRMQERKWNTALAFLVTAAGLAASTWFPNPVQKIGILCICAIGLFAIAPLFWTLPTAFLSGTAAAGGIALINSIGNLAGFAAPYMMGYLKDTTGSFSAGCWPYQSCRSCRSSWCWRSAITRRSNAPRHRPKALPPNSARLRRRRAAGAAGEGARSGSGRRGGSPLRSARYP